MKKFVFGLFAGVLLTGAALFSVDRVVDNMDTKAELQDAQYDAYMDKLTPQQQCVYSNTEC